MLCSKIPSASLPEQTTPTDAHISQYVLRLSPITLCEKKRMNLLHGLFFKFVLTYPLSLSVLRLRCVHDCAGICLRFRGNPQSTRQSCNTPQSRNARTAASPHGVARAPCLLAGVTLSRPGCRHNMQVYDGFGCVVERTGTMIRATQLHAWTCAAPRGNCGARHAHEHTARQQVHCAHGGAGQQQGGALKGCIQPTSIPKQLYVPNALLVWSLSSTATLFTHCPAPMDFNVQASVRDASMSTCTWCSDCTTVVRPAFAESVMLSMRQPPQTPTPCQEPATTDAEMISMRQLHVWFVVPCSDCTFVVSTCNH